MSWRAALRVFLAMVALDLVFAYYIVATAAGASIKAGLWASAIQLCNGVIIVSVAKNWRAVLPAAAGAFVGTWLALELV